MKENVCPMCHEHYEDTKNRECLRRTGLCEMCFEELTRWLDEGGHL